MPLFLPPGLTNPMTAAGQMIVGGSSGTPVAVGPGTAGQVPVAQSGGTSVAYQTLPGNSTVFKTPTIQTFLVGTGYYTFTVTGLTVQTNAGATYTNNGQTFTVLYTALVSATTLICSATGAPTTGSTTLTLASGTGQSSISVSSNVANGTYNLPSGPSPLYLRVKLVGGGSGGSGSGTSAGSSLLAGSTTFGSSLLTAGGGAASS
jgi:hypothetical protein